MKRTVGAAVAVLLLVGSISGCAPLLVGSAIGIVGGYAVSKDAVQGDASKPYETLWGAALAVARIRGTLKKEDYTSGAIELVADNSRVWIKVTPLAETATRLRVSCRKYHFPNLTLAQEIFLKIVTEAK